MQLSIVQHSGSCLYMLTKEVGDAGLQAHHACCKAPCCSLHTLQPDVHLFMCMYVIAGMDCPRVRYPQLNDVVETDLAEQGYQVLTDAGQQVDKVIQLYEVTAQLTWLYHHIQGC